jgi:hypothetical protein
LGLGGGAGARPGAAPDKRTCGSRQDPSGSSAPRRFRRGARAPPRRKRPAAPCSPPSRSVVSPRSGQAGALYSACSSAKRLGILSDPQSIARRPSSGRQSQGCATLRVCGRHIDRG